MNIDARALIFLLIIDLIKTLLCMVLCMAWFGDVHLDIDINIEKS